MDDTKDAQDGEVIEETDSSIVAADLPPQDPNSSVLVLESLQSLIKENLIKIDQLSVELGKQKEMLQFFSINPLLTTGLLVEKTTYREPLGSIMISIIKRTIGVGITKL